MANKVKSDYQDHPWVWSLLVMVGINCRVSQSPSAKCPGASWSMFHPVAEDLKT
jgi:hypothetical protein